MQLVFTKLNPNFTQNNQVKKGDILTDIYNSKYFVVSANTRCTLESLQSGAIVKDVDITKIQWSKHSWQSV